MSEPTAAEPPAGAGAAAQRVDFYVLPEDSDERARLRLACRLAEKAYLAGQRVLVWLEDAAALSALDELLWSFSDRSFVPHEPYAEARQWSTTPVLLACQGAPEPLYELLLNLDGELPEAAPASVRVIEIIDAQPQRRAAARERFRRHRERGANLQTHHIAADAMP